MSQPKQISRHAFLPFISYVRSERQYRKSEDGKRHIRTKNRLVAYASHRDAAIYDYYKYQLNSLYEGVVEELAVGNNVLAYRTFALPKSNIHFARDVFVEIRNRAPCVAVGLDVEDFFGSIPHDLLKEQWKRILGRAKLPDDHYSVFRSLTKWVHVDRYQALQALGRGKTSLDRWPRGNRLCTMETFRKVVRPLIRAGYTQDESTMPAGIPQGSSLSGLLSNMCLLEVDSRIAAHSETNNVIYRRYSDDVVLVGSPAAVDHMIAQLVSDLRSLGLRINEDKTVRVEFSKSPEGTCVAEKPFQYLGFTFDGLPPLIRSQTIARSIRRMKSSVKSAKRAAEAAKKRGGSSKLYRQELYARHSHLGPKRGSQLRRSTFYDYVRRSGLIMQSPRILRQLRKHWARLQREIDEAEEDLM